MKSNPQLPPPGGDAIAVEAYAWFVRCQSGRMSAGERAAFERWLRQGEAQRRAYADAQSLWTDEDLDAALRQSRPAARPSRSRRFGRGFQVSFWQAALVLLAVNFQSLRLDWQSDYYAGRQPQPVQLADGSRLMLDAGSAIAVDAQDPRRIRLLRGEVYCEVKPDPGHPFVVVGPHSQTQVLGTHFAVRSEADVDTVTVAEGKVRLSREGTAQEALALAVGEQASAYSDHLGGRVKVPAERDLAWTRGSLVFEQTPLAEAISRVQHYRQGWVLWGNPALRGFPVSGRFNLADPDRILDTLAQTLPVTFTRVSPWLLVVR